MSVSPFKTFIAGEVLTASDLNSSFLQVFNNGDDLASPATKAHDMNAFSLILDADGDTLLKANTNNLVQFQVGGIVLYEIDGTVANRVNGFKFVLSATGNAVQIQSEGQDTNVNLNLVSQGTASVVQINGVAAAGYEATTAILAMQVYS